MYRDQYERKGPFDRRRYPPKREPAEDDLDLKIPLNYIKKGQKLVVDYAIPQKEDAGTSTIEQYVGTLIAMDQHQNTLLETENDERILLRGARVVKIQFLQ